MNSVEHIAILLASISEFSVLVPLLLAALVIRTANKLMIIFVSMLVLALASEIAHEIASRWFSNSNLILNVYFVLNFCLIMIFYANALNARWQKSIALLSLTVVIFLVIASWLLQSIFVYPGPLRAFASCCVILAGLLFKFIPPTLLNNGMATLTSLRWINMGFLIYFGGSCFILLSSDFVFNRLSTEAAMLVSSIHDLFNIAKNILFAIALIHWRSSQEMSVFKPD
jgi:hypothetical protein